MRWLAIAFLVVCSACFGQDFVFATGFEGTSVGECHAMRNNMAVTFSPPVGGSDLKMRMTLHRLPVVKGDPLVGALKGQGGAPPYAYSEIGGSLPTGVSLSPDGTLSGTPSAAGYFSFLAQVQDSALGIFTCRFAINVLPSLEVAAGSPTPMEASVVYSYTFAIANAVGAVTWSISSGSIPGTMLLDSSTGELAGIGDSGPYNFTVTATDGGTGDSIDIPVFLDGADRLTVVFPPDPITLTQNTTYASLYSVFDIVIGGLLPLRATANNLPDGLTLDTVSGVISGTPTTLTPLSPVELFDISITDALGVTVSETWQYTVVAPNQALQPHSDTTPFGPAGVYKIEFDSADFDLSNPDDNTLHVSAKSGGGSSFTPDYVTLFTDSSGTTFVVEAPKLSTPRSITMTGDVAWTVSFDGSGNVTAAGTIQANAVTTSKINPAAVTLAKIQNATTNSVLLGSGASGSGSAYAEIALGTNLSMSGTTLNASGSGGGAVTVPETGTTRTASLSDAGKVIECTNPAGCAITIPQHSSVAWPTDTEICARQLGAGQVTFVAGTGVTLDPNTDSYKTRHQSALIGIKCNATDSWYSYGDTEYDIAARAVQANATSATAAPTAFAATANGQRLVGRNGGLEWEKEFAGTAGGTADALTATVSTTQGSFTLEDGMRFVVQAASANATTTPTLALNGGTARTITKMGNQALVAGDIFGAGHELLLQYVSAGPRYELLNPVFEGGSVVSLTTTGTSGAATFSGGTLNIPNYATGGALQLISRVVTSSSQATVHFASIPGTYSDLIVSVNGKDTSTAASEGLCYLKINSDGTGANYTSGVFGNNIGLLGSTTSSASGQAASTTNGAVIGSFACNNATIAKAVTQIECLIKNYTGTVFPKIMESCYATYFRSGSSNAIDTARIASVYIATPAAITDLVVTAGTTAFFDGSVVELWGRS